MRQKTEQVDKFKAQARLALRKHMREWEYGSKASLERLGLHQPQASAIMCDEPSVSLERLAEAMTRAGIKYTLTVEG